MRSWSPASCRMEVQRLYQRFHPQGKERASPGQKQVCALCCGVGYSGQKDSRVSEFPQGRAVSQEVSSHLLTLEAMGWSAKTELQRSESGVQRQEEKSSWRQGGSCALTVQVMSALPVLACLSDLVTASSFCSFTVDGCLQSEGFGWIVHLSSGRVVYVVWNKRNYFLPGRWGCISKL